LLLEERTQGSAILLVSEDLDELLSLSDRIAVMYEGEIVGTLNQKDADINTIGLMMTGSLRGDSSCSPEEQTTPAQASAEEPTSEQEAVTTFTEPRQFDRSKIVPMHRPFMESKREDKQTDDEGGE
ncbi:MAG TPA: hypothetical protein PKK82_00880, partial [Anaerolineaceae bacterium]|nr:hypothetical protein [Anaerolineaceae bacterium]